MQVIMAASTHRQFPQPIYIRKVIDLRLVVAGGGVTVGPEGTRGKCMVCAERR